MFLSIIIPVYNDEKFLNECLDSCLNQDLSKDDYEIICVDDGSTDRTPEILREYAEQYPNIQIITVEHAGYGGRSVGFAQAQGDYVWFVDHDDLIAANSLVELQQIAAVNPEYDRYTFPFYRFQNALSQQERELNLSGDLKTESDRYGNKVYAWNNLFRTAVMREKKIDPTSKQLDEAGVFWDKPTPFRIFGADTALINECDEKGVRTFQITGRPLYLYRIHAGQAISNVDPKISAWRAELRRNRVLYLGHRAWLQKQRYLSLRKQDPAAATEALADVIKRLHYISEYSSRFIEKQYWKEVIRLFRKKNVMFRWKPKDCSFSVRDKFRQLSAKERRNPKTVLGVILYFYSFTYLGANLLYMLESKKRRQENLRIKKLSENKAEAN